MKTIVLGANGQLGRDLVPRLGGEVVPLSRAEVDLTDANQIRTAIAEHRPDVVVNCAAYNLVDRAEAEPGAAFAVNAWAARDLATACGNAGVKLVHFSTDYVFGLDESRSEPLSEDDPPGPVSVYGLSKLSGEYLIRSTCPDHLVIRTCGLYGVWGSGGKGGNFVESMLRLAGQGKPLRVVADQRCTPSYTGDVATAAVELIRLGATGLVHVTNAGDCTWHELAAAIFSRSGVDADLTPIASAEWGAEARRPAYSVLSLEKAHRLGVSTIPSWQDGLSCYLAERNNRTK